MTQIKKMLFSILSIGLLAMALGVGTYALFSDTESTEANVLTAGTLDLKVNGEDNPITFTIDATNIAPGFNSGYYKYLLRNDGTLDGKLSVTFSAITNSENGINEPEDSAGDTTADVGELGQYLKPKGMWGPYGWSVPSTVISQWQTGPQNPWGIPGLNGWGERTFEYGTLAAGQEIGMFLQLSLDENLQIWDGTKWVEVDDNIIQSDGVEFTLTFKLEQVV